jgi:transcriptional regulator with PAS, ATPase and Fis domain
MKPALQAKLLHVLQDAEFTKLGSNKRVTVDVRVVAATNRDLEAMMLKGDFREDLYYRLKVIDVYVPPLRERRDEIDPLTEFFIARYARRYNRPMRPVSDLLRQQFHQYDWPGNVRELENMIKRIVVLQDESLVIQELARGPRQSLAQPAAAAPAPAPYGEQPGQPAAPPVMAVPTHLPVSYAPPMSAQHAASAGPSSLAAPVSSGVAVLDEPAPPIVPAKPMPLAEVAKNAAVRAERTAIEDALNRVHWNRRKAAVQLGVSYKTLLNKIKECGISRK